MTKHCPLCGNILETEKEKEREMCDDCLHKGFVELSKVLGQMKEKHRETK